MFPFVAHWVWSGWLAQLGLNFSLGSGFVDGGGAGPVHALGGLAALAVIWITGPRKGKFPREGLSTAMPGHNVVYVLFGCLVALVGWLAWNMAGATLWVGVTPSGLVLVAVNTVLSATAALVATFSVTRIRFGKPDASLCANGWLRRTGYIERLCSDRPAACRVVHGHGCRNRNAAARRAFRIGAVDPTTLRALSAFMERLDCGD